MRYALYNNHGPKAELSLTELELISIIKEFLRNKRNIKLGSRFIKFMAYTSELSTEETYQRIFDRPVPKTLQNHLRMDVIPRG
jgi:hypothetical protein